MSELHVLTHVHPGLLRIVRERFPDVVLHRIPEEGPIDDGLQGEVLLTQAWGSPNVGEVVKRGVRWVHTFGTGVNAFPFHAIGEDVALTCARGASAVPIAEWSMAMILAAEKDLPASWIHDPPERWNVKGLGGLAGRTLGIFGFGGIGQALARRALADSRAEHPEHRRCPCDRTEDPGTGRHRGYGGLRIQRPEDRYQGRRRDYHAAPAEGAHAGRLPAE